jgi:hypothetical protein
MAPILYLLGVAVVATLIAALVGSLIVFLALMPASLLSFLFVPILLVAFGFACAWAFPTTFIVLPVLSAMIRGAMARQIALPVAGLLAGAVTMWTVKTLQLPGGTGQGAEILIAAGALAGLAAGAVFARGLAA